MDETSNFSHWIYKLVDVTEAQMQYLKIQYAYSSYACHRVQETGGCDRGPMLVLPKGIRLLHLRISSRPPWKKQKNASQNKDLINKEN